MGRRRDGIEDRTLIVPHYLSSRLVDVRKIAAGAVSEDRRTID